MATQADLESALKALPDEEFLVFAGAAATADDLDDAIPDTLRELWGRWSELVIEAKPSIWPRPKAGEVHPSWKFEYGVKLLAPHADIDPEAKMAKLKPFAQRLGAKWLYVYTRDGIGTWQSSETLEPVDGDVFDVFLREIETLQAGIARFRLEQLNADALMARGRATQWAEPEVFGLVSSLQKRPGPELAPHIPELVETFLDNPRFTTSCLDFIAAAGPAAFSSVAQKVYSHDGKRIIELLGKVGDTSAEALKHYERGLASDNPEMFEMTLTAVRAANAKAAMTEIRDRLPGLSGDALANAVVTLGQLGEPLPPLVAGILDRIEGHAFATMLRGIVGLDFAPLGAALLEKYRGTAPSADGTLDVIEALVALGFVDQVRMMKTLREEIFPKGGSFESRALAMLERIGS